MPEIFIRNINDMEFENVSRGRVKSIRRIRLPVESGLDGVTMEYSLSIVPDGYFTPRHRHNFDQIRYTLSGVQSTGLGDLGPGECGYFAEGAYYGPQKQEGECLCLVLQFQGPSGEHLLSNEEMNATYQKMIAAGAKFENGVYTTLKPDGGKVNKDAYEAIWEEHEGRELTFPKKRYREPVMMVSENYRFIAHRKYSGVLTKHMGTFNELRTEVSMLRLEPSATLPGGRQEDVELRYVTSGSIDYDGKSWAEGTYMYVPAGATTQDISSKDGAIFFIITLPMIVDLARERAAAGQREPAHAS